MLVAPPAQVEVRSDDRVNRQAIPACTPSVRVGEVPFMHEHAELSALPHQAIRLPNPMANLMVIQRDPPLEGHPLERLRVVNRHR